MNSPKIYFLNVDLGVRHTGVESSALLRSRLFINRLGLTPIFITTKYRCQMATEVQELKKRGKLASEVTVVNLNDYLQNFASHKEGELSLYEGELIVSLSGKESQKYHDANGTLRARAFYNQFNQRLHYIVHFHQGKRWRIDYYHEGGSLSGSYFFDKDGKQAEQEILYRADSSICLIKSYACQGEDKRVLVRIQLVGSHGRLMRVVNTESELVEYFLQQYFADKQGTNILLVDRNRLFYKGAIKLKKQHGSDKIKVISAIHNLHAIDYQKKETSRININYVPVFKDLSQPDAVVVQTNAQRQDILQRFGDRSNIYAIPHTYESKLKDRSIDNRNPYKAVYFARYAQDKKHELAIEAFAKVVEKLPQAEFHCYGSGQRLAELQELVKRLNMPQHIFLHGWCENVAEQYESAALSIISSPSESFSLTIAESLAHGCPVVGFDVPYGQRELVQSGVNGYLVPYQDTEQMAERVLQIMINPELQRELSNKARESSKRFSEQTVKELWQALFQKISPNF